jgi:hypothetical protein
LLKEEKQKKIKKIEEKSKENRNPRKTRKKNSSKAGKTKAYCSLPVDGPRSKLTTTRTMVCTHPRV